MRRFVPATVAGSMLLVAGSGAMALGMGRVSTLSNLGAPLEFSVALSAQVADNLSTECISADVYAGDRRVPPEMVSVRLNRTSDGTPASLRVTTGTRIDEPVASVELMLDCGTRISRKYVVFIDPPMLELAQAGDSRPAQDSAAQTPRDPSARDVAPRTAPRRARTTGTASTPRPGGTGVASAAARQRRSEAAAAARAARAAAPVVAQAGSRLKLESAPAPLATAPVRERTPSAGTPGAGQAPGVAATGSTLPVAAVASGPASAALAAAAGASASMGGLLSELAAKAEADALALNAERLRSLEESLQRLRTDNQSMQKSMLDLQARLQEAESSRYANPVVYGLLALLGLLLLAVIALLWRQAGLRKESEWLRAAAAKEFAEEPAVPAVRSVARPTGAVLVPPAAAGAAPEGPSDAAAAQAADRPRAAAAPALADAGALVDDAPRMAAASLPHPAAAAAQATTVLPPREPGAPQDGRREVSVEELIDLEQQADFFVVLGQDDAAVDLLMGHVQGTGGASPLPYLKLLEIHRRRDEREAYQLVRERFNRRFGAFAPEWEAHSGHDRALEDYPAVIAHLQNLWPEPTAAMDELAGLLFQRDPTAQTFDLPAYGELLFLYSLARELAEDQPPSDGVDLLLPLDDHLPPSPRSGASVAGGAAVAAAAGLAAAAQPAEQLGDLSFSAIPDLDELPSIPGLPASYSPPLGFTNPDGDSGGPPALDDGLIDLNITDDPEEPKGPMSKH